MAPSTSARDWGLCRFQVAAWGASQVVLQNASVATAGTTAAAEEEQATSTAAHGGSSRVFTTGVRANKFASWKEYARAALASSTVADGASPPTSHGYLPCTEE